MGRRPYTDDEARAAFLAKVTLDPATSCWLWTGARLQNGYGSAALRRVNTTAHRVAHILFVGPIPDGLHVDHLCRNRLCVNPEHLEAVTPTENRRRADRALGVQSAAKECPQGHPYDEANTYLSPSNRRYCRECGREACRRAYLAQKAVA